MQRPRLERSGRAGCGDGAQTVKAGAVKRDADPCGFDAVAGGIADHHAALKPHGFGVLIQPRRFGHQIGAGAVGGFQKPDQFADRAGAGAAVGTQTRLGRFQRQGGAIGGHAGKIGRGQARGADAVGDINLGIGDGILGADVARQQEQGGQDGKRGQRQQNLQPVDQPRMQIVRPGPRHHVPPITSLPSRHPHHATPARSRSWMCRMPTALRLATGSTTKRQVILWSFMIAMAFSASASGVTVRGAWVIT